MVRVSDQSSPERFSETRVLVTIERDLETPAFENSPYTAEIAETADVESLLDIRPGPVRARDSDLKVRGRLSDNIAMTIWLSPSS